MVDHPVAPASNRRSRRPVETRRQRLPARAVSIVAVATIGVQGAHWEENDNQHDIPHYELSRSFFASSSKRAFAIEVDAKKLAKSSSAIDPCVRHQHEYRACGRSIWCALQWKLTSCRRVYHARKLSKRFQALEVGKRDEPTCEEWTLLRTEGGAL